MSPRFHYRIFDQLLVSAMPLPELPVLAEHVPDTAGLEVVLGMPPGRDRRAFRKVLDWPGPDGQPICTASRQGEDYWFEFPGYAGFFVTAGGRVHCVPQTGCDPRLLRHFLLNQVIPRYLGSNGRLVLHASAVALPGLGAVAFVGPSGSGKSTLAASFLEAGAELLADDCVLVDSEQGLARVIGAYPGVRLREQDIDALFVNGEAFSAPDRYSGKRQALVAKSRTADDAPWHALAALFLLDRLEGEETTLGVAAVPGSEAMVACLHSVFCLEPNAEASTVAAFGAVGGVLGRGLPVMNLRYPRCHAVLPRVRDEVVRAVAGSTAGTTAARAHA